MFDGKNILITGGTGSFGHAFVKYVFKHYAPKKMIIYSRDEMKQWNMSNKFSNIDNLRFLIGDVRDRDRLYRAFDSVDYVIHAAATKIVPIAEYNPFEAIKTNINGAMNVIDAAIDNGVKKVVALSTDKACNPVNLYGATKLASDKLFVTSNSYSKKNATCFSVVRYGNVMGSRGSVIPYFQSLLPKNVFPITDERMTRFMISLEQGIDLVMTAFNDSIGGEIYVKKIPSMKVIDLARTISKKAKFNIIGIRPGEKIHERMINEEDAAFTYEYNDYYKIMPQTNHDSLQDYIRSGIPVSKNFIYSSDSNSEWMMPEELEEWLSINKDLIGTF